MTEQRMTSVRSGLCLATAVAMSLAGLGEVPAQSVPDQTDASMTRPPAEGGVRRWQVADDVALREAPAESAAEVAALPNGAILSNLGCSEAGAQLWCEGRPFRGGASGFVPADRLVPAMGPDGLTPRGPDDSKRRARKRKFDATGQVRCAQEQGQALGLCRASVARSGGGDATVVVRFSNGFARSLYFVHGTFLSASATMSGVGTDTNWSIEAGTHRIRADDQRYEVPEAFVLGD
ncbi:MAG: hypothetical protein AAGC57_05015 [Pseudomonadota bacterium]